MAVARSYQVGDEVPPLSKTMTQEAINLFERSGGKTGPSQFTDEATARETLGTRGTVASGRMSLTFASEMLRRYFGADVYNRGGVIDLRFLPAR
jgi:acyl dehydratase